MVAVAYLGTVALVLSMLATLLLAVTTSFFTIRIPSGPDAMGMVVFFILSIVIWLLLLAASMMCVSCGGFDWLSSIGGVPTATVFISVVALGVLSLFATAAGLDRNFDYRPLIGMAGAVGLPLVVQAYLAILMWRPAGRLAAESWPKLVGAPLALLALASIVMCMVMWGRMQYDKSKRLQAAMAEREQEQLQEMERQKQATITQDAELAAMSNDLPLEQFLVRLGIDKTEAHHVKVMERIAALPRLREQIERILASDVPMDREWALNYVRHCTNPDPDLVPAVRQAMRKLEGEIRAASKDQSIYAKGLMWGMLQTADSYKGVRFDDEVKAIGAAMEQWPDEDARMVAHYYTDLYLKGQPIPR